MWIRTINGWKLFKIEYTEQGIPYPTKEITGKSNLE
jgi:hypothetical protein